MNAKPLSERLCDRMVFVVAAWTVLCNVTVLAGGGLNALSIATGVSIAAYAVVARGDHSACRTTSAAATRIRTG